MGKIKKLNDNLINLIAAGEVVERPASVVKELIENSLDAGSSEITLKIENGGIEYIEVADNGEGMDPADALLAFTQHATSKISTEEDLQNILSLGFRGEALASISSVAEVQMETLKEGSIPTKISAARSVLEHQDGFRTSTGTTIVVKNLFEGIPARKKFLKAEATEFSHVTELFKAIALCHLQVRFNLIHNGKQVYQLPQAPDLPTRIFDIFGEEVSDNLFINTGQQTDLQIHSLVGKPEIARNDRKLQYVFVNGRQVSDRVVQKAIQEAFRGFIHRDLNPVYFVFLKINPARVDVNVHPRKQEVRFSDSGAVYRLVYNTIRSSLETQTRSELLNRVAQGQDFQQPSQPLYNVSYRPEAAATPPPAKAHSHKPISFTKSLLAHNGEQEFQPIIVPIQLFNTYILYQLEDKIVIIDQHAAAESIQYNKLVNATNMSASRPRLVPEIIEFSNQDKQELLAQAATLARVGLVIEDFGPGSIQVVATPAALDKFDAKAMLHKLLSDKIDIDQTLDRSSLEEQKLNLEELNPKLHLLLATVACHGSIRAGQKLSVPEMQQIIQELSEVNHTYNCPHGRPVSWELSRYQLEKNFDRVI